MWQILSSNYAKLLGIDMGIQVVGWIVAVIFKTEKFYDLTGNQPIHKLATNSLNSQLISRLIDVHHHGSSQLQLEYHEIQEAIHPIAHGHGLGIQVISIF